MKHICIVSLLGDVDFNLSAKKPASEIRKPPGQGLRRTPGAPAPGPLRRAEPRARSDSAQKSPLQSPSPLRPPHHFAMLPSHLNGHSALGRRRPRLSAAAASGDSAAAGVGAAAPLEEHDRIYFQSYSHLGIHEAMIKVSRCAYAHIRSCVP